MPLQTIQEALTDLVPAFVLDVNAPINPRPVRTWMMVDPNDVMYWQGFNLANLRNAYGHIFDLPCPTCPVSDAHPRFVIQTLDELKQHGIETLHHLLQRPLQYAIPKLRQNLLCSKHDVLCDYKAPHTQIDWIWGVFYALDDTNLVVSCSRLSDTFTSEDLRLKKPDAIYTLRQLATYAAIGKTRYGFILTDKEVVIVRFHVKGRNIEEYAVGWVAIPWRETGIYTLTAPLAVFSLVLMSLNDDHRHILVGNNTLPLDAWIREKLWDGKVIFYHHLSGRCVDKLPEGVGFYWEPKKKKKRSAVSHAIALARRLTEPLANINE
ncbi:hypothetical protein NCS57_00431700 [Fusarium keratoplasticum]|uniref:Uncharacterized protein n=1 Tax=Fusarium keratoplasticum TaxID=1328300 RepID=A0ACC0R4Z6_9HYPO|nr:hypothetical protein NCS57_00431700 [Fusarium keratoplasticum]KAI8675308.1 hypothetical protein NCS57_00431700 [Fusarium keratoplasticum]